MYNSFEECEALPPAVAGLPAQGDTLEILCVTYSKSA